MMKRLKLLWVDTALFVSCAVQKNSFTNAVHLYVQASKNSASPQHSGPHVGEAYEPFLFWGTDSVQVSFEGISPVWLL